MVIDFLSKKVQDHCHNKLLVFFCLIMSSKSIEQKNSYKIFVDNLEIYFVRSVFLVIGVLLLSMRLISSTRI